MKTSHHLCAAGMAVACLLAVSASRADVITDWNTVAGNVIVQSKMGTPPATRIMAIVQTAVHEAVVAAQQSQPGDTVATEAAVAAANRASLVKLFPQQEAAINTAYRDAIAKLADSPARAAGIAAGEQAGTRVVAWRASDGAAAADRYVPHAAPGAYVPTASVATPQWPGRMTWLMDSPSQFRPGPPPAMNSAQWVRDYNEVKAVGAKASRVRTPEQTEVAKFWEYSLPPIYQNVARSVALMPGRSVAQNARMFAAASQAMDDALVAVMDAKYQYGFWRPVTAIRNGDRDDNPATEAEAGWTPFIENPMHPEYPSAHSILAAALGEVLKAEVGAGRSYELTTSSPTANNVTRRWTDIDAFAREVGEARVWEGIHFRTSTDVGLAMGRKIGALGQNRVAMSPGAPAPLAQMPGSAQVALEDSKAQGR